MHGAPVSGSDDATVRATEVAALADVLAVLQLAGAGRLRASEKTQRPTAATVAAVAEVARSERALWRLYLVDPPSCRHRPRPEEARAA